MSFPTAVLILRTLYYVPEVCLVGTKTMVVAHAFSVLSVYDLFVSKCVCAGLAPKVNVALISPIFDSVIISFSHLSDRLSACVISRLSLRQVWRVDGCDRSELGKKQPSPAVKQLKKPNGVNSRSCTVNARVVCVLINVRQPGSERCMSVLSASQIYEHITGHDVVCSRRDASTKETRASVSYRKNCIERVRVSKPIHVPYVY